MNQHRRRQRLAILVFGLSITAAPSRADMVAPVTINFTIPGGAFATLAPPNGDYTGSPPNSIASGTTFPTVVDVPQFDPSQGSLTGVSLQLSATQSGGSADFYAVFGPGATSIEFDRAVVLTGAASISLSANYSSTASSIPVGTVFTQDLSAPLVTTTQTFTDPANLAAFVGQGDVALSAIRSLDVYPSPSSEVYAKLTSTGSATGELTVTYTYTPVGVPEPSSLCLLALALMLTSTAAFSRRRGQA